ncbi:hypothetical protein [Rhodobacteraceae bacterium DSL-40]
MFPIRDHDPFLTASWGMIGANAGAFRLTLPVGIRWRKTPIPEVRRDRKW